MTRAWLCLVLGACAARGDAEDAERAIGAMLDDWHDAAAKADEARYFGHFTDDAIFLGTDASERWTTDAFRAYAHPHFAKGRAWAFHAVRRDIVRGGADLAWFDEDLATENLGPARGSGVVVRRGGGWRIAHYNLALTIPNERFDLVKEAAAAEVAVVRDADPLASYAWLAGAWLGRRGDEVVEEVWTTPSGATMIGLGRIVAGDRTTFFELMRIEVGEAGVVLKAQPLGRPAHDFRAEKSAPGVLVFTDPGHDWPKRIEYKRTTTGGIEVRVEGAPGERVEAWTYRPMVIPRGD